MINVTENALQKRINRKLAHVGESVRRGRNPWCAGRGFLHLDLRTSTVLAAYDDLEALARGLRVLRADEVAA